MLAIVAVTLGAINVFGGFAVTERMLQMFKRKEPRQVTASRHRTSRSPICVAIALFIYGLHDLNSPATARRGNRLAMVGMFDRARRDLGADRRHRLVGDRASA